MNFVLNFLSNTTDSYIMKEETGGENICTTLCVCPMLHTSPCGRGESAFEGSV